MSRRPDVSTSPREALTALQHPTATLSARKSEATLSLLDSAKRLDEMISGCVRYRGTIPVRILYYCIIYLFIYLVSVYWVFPRQVVYKLF